MRPAIARPDHESDIRAEVYGDAHGQISLLDPANDVRRCPRCRETKPRRFYCQSKYETVVRPCKLCAQEQSKAYHHAHKDVQNAKRRARVETSEQKERRYKRMRKTWFHRHLAATYGLAPDLYYEMLEFQAGLCASCCAPMVPGKHTCVDHDHATGRVRGLVCGACNMAIGFVESRQRARDACVYLLAYDSAPLELFAWT